MHHHATMSPCHHAIISPWYHTTIPPCHHATIPPCYYTTISPCQHIIVHHITVTISPCDHVNISLWHHVTISMVSWWYGLTSLSFVTGVLQNGVKQDEVSIHDGGSHTLCSMWPSGRNQPCTVDLWQPVSLWLAEPKTYTWIGESPGECWFYMIIFDNIWSYDFFLWFWFSIH